MDKKYNLKNLLRKLILLVTLTSCVNAYASLLDVNEKKITEEAKENIRSNAFGFEENKGQFTDINGKHLFRKYYLKSMSVA